MKKCFERGLFLVSMLFPFFPQLLMQMLKTCTMVERVLYTSYIVSAKNNQLWITGLRLLKSCHCVVYLIWSAVQSWPALCRCRRLWNWLHAAILRRGYIHGCKVAIYVIYLLYVYICVDDHRKSNCHSVYVFPSSSDPPLPSLELPS